MPARTFINQQGTSNKFWTIEVSGAEHSVHYGRIGTDGQVKTKAYADDAKATAAAEKLIAEKLAKGYTEEAAATAPPAERVEAAQAAAAAAALAAYEDPTPVAAPAPPAAPAPSPAGPAPELRSGLSLRPDEWAWAAWRPAPDAPGPAREFDRARAAAGVRQARVYDYWNWAWREAPFEGRLSREEAGAWLRLMGENRRDAPSVLARAMADYDEPLPGEREAVELAADSHLPFAYAMAALADLIGADEVVGWLLAPDSGIKDRWGRDAELLDLALGVRAGLLPRLTPDAVERFADAVTARSAQDPEHRMTALLAAQLGLHDLVQAALDKGVRGYRQSGFPLLFGLGSAEAVRAALSSTDSLDLYRNWEVAGVLAHTEVSALDQLGNGIAKATNKDVAEILMEPLTRVHDPAAAPVMLELTKTSRAPGVARDWLIAHPLETAVGLARTLPGRARPDVVDYLRSRKRGGDDLAAALPHLDADAAARLTELVLDHEDAAGRELTRAELPPELAQALEAAPVKKVPGFVEPAALPPVVVGDAGRLGLEDLAVILTACAQLKPGEPVPELLPTLARHADAEAFAWGLFEAWLGDGGPSRNKWAMLAVGPLGGDASATKLAPLIRAWPGESQHQRAVLGLGVLGAIGSDTALMLLSGIAEKVKFKALKERAREAMDEIAAAKGMTKAELEDRIVPDCGLDERGTRTFEIGGKTYTFALGPGMKPMLRDDATGKLRASPPKPSDEWKLLRKQVADVAKIQSVRLEQAMVTQRRWTVEGFETFIVRHPLQRHLAKLLVWRSGATTFRVTDELDYADSDDEPIALDGEIGLVHPLQLSDDERAAWGEQLADYEIVPPFPQLGRPVYDVERGEQGDRRLKRFARQKIAAATLVRQLENLGWQRGVALDNGIFTLHLKPFPALDMTAVVRYDGVPMGYMVDWEDQAIEEVYVLAGLVDAWELGWGDRSDRRRQTILKWGEVDPIIRSEVLADIAAITAKAR